MADAFDGLPPESFTPEARARRQMRQDLAQFEEVPLEELLPADPDAQAILEAGVRALAEIPREEWVRMCREGEAADLAAWKARQADDDELSFLR